jgi:hypothetical protein
MDQDNKDKEGNMFVDMLYGNTLYVLSIIVVSISATAIFNFLGIEFEYYGIYLIFFIGLAILSQVLPKNKISLLRKASNKT